MRRTITNIMAWTLGIGQALRGTVGILALRIVVQHQLPITSPVEGLTLWLCWSESNVDQQLAVHRRDRVLCRRGRLLGYAWVQ
jgi:hypothetical protein